MKTYPPHLYQPIRIRIATDYLKSEMRKLLSGMRGEVWKEIDREIEGWWNENGEVKVRDFWNGWHGIAMGFKLKLGLIQVVTAENVEWRLEERLPLDDKVASGGDLRYIDEELSESRPRAARLREFFARENKQELAEIWLERFRAEDTKTEPRIQFPIIAMEEVDKGEKIWSIHEGNRRMVLGILEGKDTIRAYVGRYVGDEKKPKNFWLPSSFLMELVKEGELADSFEETAGLLKKLVKLSQSAEYELRERVLVGKNEFRMRLREELGWD